MYQFNEELYWVITSVINFLGMAIVPTLLYVSCYMSCLPRAQLASGEEHGTALASHPSWARHYLEVPELPEGRLLTTWRLMNFQEHHLTNLEH